MSCSYHGPAIMSTPYPRRVRCPVLAIMAIMSCPSPCRALPISCLHHVFLAASFLQQPCPVRNDVPAAFVFDQPAALPCANTHARSVTHQFPASMHWGSRLSGLLLHGESARSAPAAEPSSSSSGSLCMVIRPTARPISSEHRQVPLRASTVWGTKGLHGICSGGVCVCV